MPRRWRAPRFWRALAMYVAPSAREKRPSEFQQFFWFTTKVRSSVKWYYSQCWGKKYSQNRKHFLSRHFRWVVIKKLRCNSATKIVFLNQITVKTGKLSKIRKCRWKLRKWKQERLKLKTLIPSMSNQSHVWDLGYHRPAPKKELREFKK